MILLRIYLARAILWAGAAAAEYILPEFAALDRAERRKPAARPCPAGMNPAARSSAAGSLLLASIVGMAICGLWIAFTWRAWA